MTLPRYRLVADHNSLTLERGPWAFETFDEAYDELKRLRVGSRGSVVDDGWRIYDVEANIVTQVG